MDLRVPKNSKVYLGDSVYAEYEPRTDMVCLYFDNGRGANSPIYIEGSTARVLVSALVDTFKIKLEKSS